ncbi:hypothetical protein EHQ52_15605 [Leptospira koniambonensis]|uniref:Prolipoprotein diacylglyceryl transferase n=2 Tax=Leptospira koniambonensis TaxID=2484950 RepID=A0A4R9J5E6_9LEPT|nr:hypothetical protein EHQ52_15605 [Leptospira koniambonensis]
MSVYSLKKASKWMGVPKFLLLLIIVNFVCILGCKVFYVLEIWGRIWYFENTFVNSVKIVFFTWDGFNRVGQLGLWSAFVSGSGRSLLGAIVFFYFAIRLFCKISNEKGIDEYMNLLLPGALLGISIGKIGCWISGDGDFGQVVGFHLPPLSLAYSTADGAIVDTYGMSVLNLPFIEIILFVSLSILFIISPLKLEKNRDFFSITLLFYLGLRFVLGFLSLESPFFGPYENLDLSALKSGEDLRTYHWQGITFRQLVAIIYITNVLIKTKLIRKIIIKPW